MGEKIEVKDERRGGGGALSPLTIYVASTPANGNYSCFNYGWPQRLSLAAPPPGTSLLLLFLFIWDTEAQRSGARPSAEDSLKESL